MKVNSLESSDDETLLRITRDHPYFALPWFYLLKKTGKLNEDDLTKYRQKASVFFTDPAWLHWQLAMDKSENDNPHEIISKEEDSEEKIREEGQTIKNQPTDPVSAHSVVDFENDPGTEVNRMSPSRSTPENTGVERIEFEPLHTVDYFASQGIKIADEPVPGDKLGHQLKSFTDWIKSMKKIHAHMEASDPQTDQRIQGIADASNIDIEVITEAMADVLIKQDKIGKAIEMYEKLSLNNPSKSAYFAAKIERLKSS
ncbi:MAG: hypothetical protein ABJA57_04795 [Ginsengibacter sp.]